MRGGRPCGGLNNYGSEDTGCCCVSVVAASDDDAPSRWDDSVGCTISRSNCPIPGMQDEGPPQVWVLMGGEGEGRQAALAAGRAAYLATAGAASATTCGHASRLRHPVCPFCP